MVKPRRPLPEQFAWRRWSIENIHHHKPGHPAPDAIIFELSLHRTRVVRIMSLQNSVDQWLVTIHAGLAKVHQSHAIVEGEARARAWCERWVARELDYLMTRFSPSVDAASHGYTAKHAYTTIK